MSKNLSISKICIRKYAMHKVSTMHKYKYIGNNQAAGNRKANFIPVACRLTAITFNR